MDVWKAHGAFSWCELMTTDVEAAKRFYTKLFGWGTKQFDMPDGPYTTVQVGEDSVGGIMRIPADAPPTPPHWGCYVTVDKVEDTVALAQSLGGTVLVPVMEVPGVGRMAVLRDPQGAVLSVMTYTMPSD